MTTSLNPDNIKIFLEFLDSTTEEIKQSLYSLNAKGNRALAAKRSPLDIALQEKFECDIHYLYNNRFSIYINDKLFCDLELNNCKLLHEVYHDFKKYDCPFLDGE